MQSANVSDFVLTAANTPCCYCYFYYCYYYHLTVLCIGFVADLLAHNTRSEGLVGDLVPEHLGT